MLLPIPSSLLERRYSPCVVCEDASLRNREILSGEYIQASPFSEVAMILLGLPQSFRNSPLVVTLL